VRSGPSHCHHHGDGDILNDCLAVWPFRYPAHTDREVGLMDMSGR
jgi:hypothetical protein